MGDDPNGWVADLMGGGDPSSVCATIKSIGWCTQNLGAYIDSYHSAPGSDSQLCPFACGTCENSPTNHPNPPTANTTPSPTTTDCTDDPNGWVEALHIDCAWVKANGWCTKNLGQYIYYTCLQLPATT